MGELLVLLVLVLSSIILYFLYLAVLTIWKFLQKTFSPLGEINQIPKELDISWKIKKLSYSLWGEHQCSHSFSFANEIWHLVLFPNANCEAKNPYGFICVYLVRDSSGPPIRVEFSFSLKTLIKKSDLEQQRSHIFEKAESQYGFDRFLSRTELRERQLELMPSNTLTVVCTLKHPELTDPIDKNFPKLLQQSKLLQDFKELYLNPEDSDVTIRVNEQVFPAHRLILKARSPVFASTFRNDMKEKATGIMNIEDCDPSIFSEFLRFLYYGYINNLSSENVFNMFTVADKYDVPDLRIKCLVFMKENLSVDTFFETMTLALHHSVTELIELTTHFFVKNAENIIRTTKWELYIVENPTHSNKLLIDFMTLHKGSKS